MKYVPYFDLGKRKFVAVLHEGSIDSPEKAVQAAIVKEFKDSGK